MRHCCSVASSLFRVFKVGITCFENKYDGACIRMRLLNFLMVLRVLEELMVVRLLILLMAGFLMRFLQLMICFDLQ